MDRRRVDSFPSGAEMKSFWRDEMRIADFAAAVKEHENVVAVEQWFLFSLRLVTSSHRHILICTVAMQSLVVRHC